MLISLTGAHRVGKTSLARAYAEKHGIMFVETSVSAIFKELGHDPAAAFDFKTRLDIQEVILERLDAVYGLLPPTVQAITDRTPIDMLAYTVSEAVGNAVMAEDQERFKRYVARCFEVINKRFAALILVQPGIPLVNEAGKAVMNEAYIEHLNTMCFGLTVDPRVKVSHFYIARSKLSMKERLGAIESAVGKLEHFAVRSVTDYVESGGRLQ